MIIREAMTRDVRMVSPSDTIRLAARKMADIDAGVLPVSENDRLVGIITDRDIAVRGVALGKTPDATVGEVMTPEVLYCFEDEDVEDVCENMSDQQVRRLPVVNREKRLVGIISLADIASAGGSGEVGEALEGITRPGGERSQSTEARP